MTRTALGAGPSENLNEDKGGRRGEGSADVDNSFSGLGLRVFGIYLD